jgi:GT2 family glycosyltransferase
MSLMIKQPVSIVIPNYNGAKLLPIVLSSVVDAVNFSKIDYQILVIDDCSKDASKEIIDTLFAGVEFIVNEVNLGFSETVNKGVNLAKHELVLILNNDVKLNPDYFEDQFKFFELENTFGVNGTIVNWDDDNLQGGGKLLRAQGFKIKTNTNFYIQNPNAKINYKTSFLTGTNALVSKSKFLEIGGFCYLFSPYYVEDVELSVRAIRNGYHCYYSISSVCRHQISATIKKHASQNKILQTNIRNKYFLHALHLNGLNLIGWTLQLLFELLFRLVTGKTVFIKAFLDFIKKYDAIIEYRKTIEKQLSSKNIKNDGLKVIKTLEQEILNYQSISTHS